MRREKAAMKREARRMMHKKLIWGQFNENFSTLFFQFNSTKFVSTFFSLIHTHTATVRNFFVVLK